MAKNDNFCEVDWNYIRSFYPPSNFFELMRNEEIEILYRYAHENKIDIKNIIQFNIYLNEKLIIDKSVKYFNFTYEGINHEEFLFKLNCPYENWGDYYKYFCRHKDSLMFPYNFKRLPPKDVKTVYEYGNYKILLIEDIYLQLKKIQPQR